MEITAFYPVIQCKDLEAALKAYEAMGFERKHTIENFALKTHVLELNGNRVDIFSFKTEMEMFDMSDGFYCMRVNVRDFEKGVEFCEARGYKLLMDPFENDFMRGGILGDKEGRKIFLYNHFREEEREARAAQQ